MALVSNILTQVFITLIAVAGVYVLTGLTGMFSLGQAAFMAIGSYASGLLVVKAHMPLVPAIIIAVALATLVGYLIGYPVVRLRRDYISLVTLGFGEAIAALLNRMTSLTGGASGFTGIPRKTTLTIAAVSAVLAIALVAFFKSSKYGRQCIALRGGRAGCKGYGHQRHPHQDDCVPAECCADGIFRLSVCVLYVLCGSHWIRLEKKCRLGHHGVFRRRQQPYRFHAGGVHP